MLAVEINIESKMYRLSVPIRPVIEDSLAALAGMVFIWVQFPHFITGYTSMHHWKIRDTRRTFTLGPKTSTFEEILGLNVSKG